MNISKFLQSKQVSLANFLNRSKTLKTKVRFFYYEKDISYRSIIT